MIYEELTEPQKEEFTKEIVSLVSQSDSLYLMLLDLIIKSKTPLEPAIGISKTVTPDGEEINH